MAAAGPQAQRLAPKQGAADPRDLKALSDLNKAVRLRPGWQNYLARAIAQEKCAVSEPAPEKRALQAVKDCQSSLALQKNPLAHYYMARAYLLAGPPHFKEANKAALLFGDAMAAGPDSTETLALTEFLNGDLAASRQNLVQFTTDHVRIGHPESHNVLPGPIWQMTQREVVFVGRPPLGLAPARLEKRKLLYGALIDYFKQRYGAVAETFKRFKSAPGAATAAEKDFMQTLACCNSLMTLRHEEARLQVGELLKGDCLDYGTLVLLDTVYYALTRREEGLKLLAANEAKNPRACVLAKARVLDEIAQPKAALEVLKGFARARPNDYEVLLQIARLEMQLNKDAQAMEHLRQYIAKNPTSGQAYFMRAQLAVQKKQWEKAYADLSRAIDYSYNLTKALRARSGCDGALGHVGQAKDDMDLAAAFYTVGYPNSRALP